MNFLHERIDPIYGFDFGPSLKDTVPNNITQQQTPTNPRVYFRGLLWVCSLKFAFTQGFLQSTWGLLFGVHFMHLGSNQTSLLTNRLTAYNSCPCIFQIHIQRLLAYASDRSFFLCLLFVMPPFEEGWAYYFVAVCQSVHKQFPFIVVAEAEHSGLLPDVF